MDKLCIFFISFLILFRNFIFFYWLFYVLVVKLLMLVIKVFYINLLCWLEVFLIKNVLNILKWYINMSFKNFDCFFIVYVLFFLKFLMIYFLV